MHLDHQNTTHQFKNRIDMFISEVKLDFGQQTDSINSANV